MLSALRDFFLRHGTKRAYFIALSGGLDSCVLLALSAKLREELSLDLRAIHINHQLSSNAAHWARHCKTLCDANAIDCIVHSVTLSLEAGDSTEEKAREKRYAAFANYLDHDAMVLTAHHQDDQAETLLFQLFPGP